MDVLGHGPPDGALADSPVTTPRGLDADGKCPDVTGGGTANGTLVDLYICNGTGAQVWQPQSGGAVVNPQPGSCLDDTGWLTETAPFFLVCEPVPEHADLPAAGRAVVKAGGNHGARGEAPAGHPP